MANWRTGFVLIRERFTEDKCSRPVAIRAIPSTLQRRNWYGQIDACKHATALPEVCAAREVERLYSMAASSKHLERRVREAVAAPNV
eukprot:scaffold662667_cov50-Prasinocladus_malaysianus.AAC.3